MYQVTIKARSLDELKKASNDLSNELNNNNVVHGMEKNLSIKETLAVIQETTGADLAEDEIDVPSPFKEYKQPEGNLVVETSNPSSEMADFVQPTPVVNQILAKEAIATMTDLDSEGVPWDKRIHAGSRTKIAAGTWKTKRGADMNEVFKIKGELLEALKHLANPAAIPQAPAAAVHINQPLIEKAAEILNVTLPTEVITKVVEPAAAPLPTMQVASGHTLATFKQGFAMILGTLISEGKVSQEYVEQLKGYFGVAQIHEVNEVQQEEMFNSFVAHNLIQQVA